MKILLHVCCAPCSLGVIDRALEEGDITLFFYNPNIYPSDEYQKRLEALKEVIARRYPTLELIEKGYNESEFLACTTGLEGEKEGGKRCDECIRLRMEKTARLAKELGFDGFTTTLSVSPHKSYPLIKKLGQELENAYNVKYVDVDFKKKDGFLKSTRLSKEMGIYRQNYCGCRYSKNDERDQKQD